MTQPASTGTTVQEQVESIPTSGLTSHPGCRSFAIFAGVCALIVGLAFSAVAGWVLQQYSHRAAGSKPQTRQTRSGDSVDGQFAFRLNSGRCGVTEVGVSPNVRKPQGQYCVYVLRIRNVGEQPRVLTSSNQHAIDVNGHVHTADILASEAASPTRNPFPKLMWRDQVATVALAFDIPRGTLLASLRLHDSPWSDGVKMPVAHSPD